MMPKTLANKTFRARPLENPHGYWEDCMSSVRIVLITLCASSALLGCATSAPDLEQARRAVAAADSAWAAAAAAHDLEASVNAMAEDGIMFPPDQAPVVGRTAIKAYMAAAFATPGFSVQWVTGDIGVAPGGDLAYSFDRSRYTVPDSSGTIRTIHAKGVTVWRREADGRWRCVADIWNGAPE
jgi:uncharacterized protein (TIGR02246 family)